MPSSTSSSKLSVDLIDYQRPAPAGGLAVASLLALLSAVLGLGLWEAHWRGFGAEPSIVNSDGLWAMQRRRINGGEGDATVLVGSSRTLSDVQLDVWREVTGETPIQLALEGTSPAAFVEDLADDPDFNGKLIIGVAPGLFFSGYAYRGDALEYARKETPSQRAGQWLSMHVLEPYFAFLDPDFALFAVLKRQPWPAREGVHERLDVRKLFVGDARRNNRLWDKLQTDQDYRELARSIWQQGYTPLADKPPEAREQIIRSRSEQISRVSAAARRLRARGVPVVFVQHPYTGFYARSEPDIAPRAESWDRLLTETGLPGIHFQDHTQLKGYELPEYSHMTGESADRYTAALAPLVVEALAAQRAGE